MFREDENPADIYYQGKPFSIIQQDANRLHFTVKVPFTEEKDLDITRFGSEVIIKIRSATGYLVNVIPLPMITYNMEMLQASLDNNVLNIIFEKKFWPNDIMDHLNHLTKATTIQYGLLLFLFL